MFFVSWNVNGIRAALKKGLLDNFNSLNADIFAIQETKCQPDQVDLELPGYYKYFNSAVRKGYSGTAVFSKIKPISIIEHIWDSEQRDNNEEINIIDNEGRILALEFDNYWFVCVYTPNAQKELARIDLRLLWGSRFTEFCKELESGIHNNDGASKDKPVIMCGDFNVAHKEIDLKNPKQNVGNPGFSDEEREDFSKLLDAGFTDTFRYLYPDKTDAYSWWSYRAKSRERNVGWRIDYFLVSNNIADNVEQANISSDIYGSDHCPISLKINI